MRRKKHFGVAEQELKGASSLNQGCYFSTITLNKSPLNGKVGALPIKLSATYDNELLCEHSFILHNVVCVI